MCADDLSQTVVVFLLESHWCPKGGDSSFVYEKGWAQVRMGCTGGGWEAA